MIYFDVTKAGAARHRSGLTRVSARLREELGGRICAVAWSPRGGGFRALNGAAAEWRPADWLLTPELFSGEERPGFGDFLRARRGRLAAIFHDAIPLKFPQITWPRSVARHPEYLKMLAGFDRVWAVSETSRRELTEFWRWQGTEPRAETAALTLGADFDGSERRAPPAAPPAPALLMTGILEPRKNQAFLLEVCEELWTEGLAFELHLAGRMNPQFGRPVAARIKALRKRRPGLRWHPAAGDAELARLYAAARATVFPTLAEGCGLPVLESLWRAVPCVCSDLPALRENTAAGGCRVAAVNDRAAWKRALRAVLTDDGLWRELARAAAERPLPRWRDTAAALLAALT